MKKGYVVVSIFSSLVLLLAGCRGSDVKNVETISKGTSNESAVSTDGNDSIVAYIGTSMFDNSLDPIKGAMSNGYPFINNALLKVNTDSEYEGDLANDWSISEDALSYTFKLRKDVTFSDGSPFTAKDVVFTYQMVMDHQAYNENVDLTKLDKVTALDDYTVEFRLKECYSPFFDIVAKLQIVPHATYQSEIFDTTPIGTGAYKVVEYDTNQQIILQANDYYYGNKPKIKKITLVYMDQDAAYAAAQSGQLDIVMVSPRYSKEIVKGMRLEAFETMDVRNISLPIRREQKMDFKGDEVIVGNEVTSDIAVRKALAVGIDRQTIINNAFNGVGVEAVNFTSNLIWADTKTFEDGKKEEAIKILESAGWVDIDHDGIREKDGLECSFDLYAAANDNDRYLLGVALAEEANNLGIQINVKTATWDEIHQLEYTSAIVWGWGQYSPTVLQSLLESDRYLTGGYDNVVGYNNEKVDTLIDEAINANNQQTAIIKWKEIQQIANQDYPYLFLVNIEHCYFVKDNLDLSNETQIPHPHGHGNPILCNVNEWSFR